MDVQKIKQRFGIIGNSVALGRAIDVAARVAPTDLSVLITGESGTGKEIFSHIVHELSIRKHKNYIAVNCGAIPEGTIDSELFGHEKGAFTGAHESRKGYFEVADGGTIFLDEVAELPLSTQVRLLRVLETGEFIRVGSSKVIKTNVRVVAATNVNILRLIGENQFREDLYYRLNTVPITIPPLRERKDDIILLFRKFAQDFAEKYQMPPISLTFESQQLLINYRFPGNIRQLKNITEQISILERNREISVEKLRQYLPIFEETKLPVLLKNDISGRLNNEFIFEIFKMRNEINDLKKIIRDFLMRYPDSVRTEEEATFVKKVYKEDTFVEDKSYVSSYNSVQENIQDTEEIKEEPLSFVENEVDLIKKALAKHKGRRKKVAQELGISERTLYRKLSQHNLLID